MKPNKDKNGYLLINLRLTKGVRTVHKIHRLVMEHFVGPSELTVNHKDGDKQNNDLSNLEYLTIKENTIHAYETGLNPTKEFRIYKHSTRKGFEIRQNGKYIKYFTNGEDAKGFIDECEINKYNTRD